MWYYMFHCMFKAEFVTLGSLKVPRGCVHFLDDKHNNKVFLQIKFCQRMG